MCSSDLAKSRGYSAVKIEGMSDLGGDMQTQWSILDPSAVRSRFAAFDPAKKDSADLLAGIAGLPGVASFLSGLNKEPSKRGTSKVVK